MSQNYYQCHIHASCPQSREKKWHHNPQPPFCTVPSPQHILGMRRLGWKNRWKKSKFKIFIYLHLRTVLLHNLVTISIYQGKQPFLHTPTFSHFDNQPLEYSLSLKHMTHLSINLRLSTRPDTSRVTQCVTPTTDFGQSPKSDEKVVKKVLK